MDYFVYVLLIILIDFFLQFRPNLKCVNNKKNLKKLQKSNAQWFRDAIKGSGLYAPTRTNYTIIDHDLLSLFFERWHEKTFNFNFLIGEMTVVMEEVSCLLHLPIQGRLLDLDEKLGREAGEHLMFDLIGVDLGRITMKWISQTRLMRGSATLRLNPLVVCRHQVCSWSC